MLWAEHEPVVGVPSDLRCPAGSRYVAGTQPAETVFHPGRGSLQSLPVTTSHLYPQASPPLLWGAGALLAPAHRTTNLAFPAPRTRSGW